MELQAGQIFSGRFRLVRSLGGGGFGEVHEAEELKDGTRIALKVLHQEMVSHPTLRERFEQESRITSLFKSPYVVTVVDAGVDAATGRPWVAFELLSGETLATRLTREPALDAALVSHLFAQLGEAIGAAHQAGVIHADLKPENLFLTGPTSAPTLKVLDFGIARMLKAGRTSTKVTTEMGSPGWTAPEQFLRGAKLRASTDVWPLGLLAFRALAGVHYLLNAGEDGQVIPCIAEICVNELPAASARAQELGVEKRLPADFDRWFRHCVVRQPDERFQHGRAAVNALLALLRPKSTVAATVALTEPPISPWRVSGGTVAIPTRVVPAVLELLDRQDYAKARHALESSSQGDASAEVWALRGECDLALGRYDDAVDDWSNAIARGPTVGAYLYGRSLAFEAQGRMAAAKADAVLAAALGHEGARQRVAAAKG